MYRSHFGFDRMPFDAKVGDWNHVEIAEQRQAAEAIASEFEADLQSLIGSPGTGKSTLVARFAPAIGNAVAIPGRSAKSNPERSLLEDIGAALGHSIDQATSTPDLESLLRSDLRRRSEGGDRVRLFVDDADALEASALLALWSLGRPDSSDARLFAIVLLGQPSLGELLARESLRALQENVSARIRLESIDRHGCRHYIRRRLMLAGSTSPALFTPSAIDRIQLGSDGNLALINILCHRSLKAACEDREYQVGRRHVAEAIGTTEGITQWKTRPLIGRRRVSVASPKRIANKWNHSHGQPS